MTTREKILSLLKGSDSTKPFTCGELRRGSGLSDDDLQLELARLYDERMINRATITRGGIAQLHVWQVGNIPAIPFRQLVLGTQLIGERKPEVVIAAIKNEEKPMEETKSKVQIMLDLIVEKGSVISGDLCRAAGGVSGVKPFLGGYMARGLIVYKDSPKGKIYSIAPGVKPEQLQSQSAKKAAQSQPAQTPAPCTPEAIGNPFVSGAQPAPAIAPEPKPEPMPVAPSPVKIKALTVDDLPSFLPQLTVAPLKPRFRVALTSDETIMLFGLAEEPIELDREQAALLTKFVADKGDLLCV